MSYVIKALLIAVWMGGSLAACATAPVPIGLPCSVGPLIPDKGASTRWTLDEQRQLAVINGTGEILCKWKPPA